MIALSLAIRNIKEMLAWYRAACDLPYVTVLRPEASITNPNTVMWGEMA